MPLGIKVSLDSLDIEKKLTKLAKGEIADATAHALTMLAQDGAKAVRSEMEEVFDNPTPFTLNAFYAKPAKSSDLTAYVESRDWAPKGVPAIKYLMPQIFGGPRPAKRSETLMASISGGQYWIPARGAPKDRYGNIPASEISKILSRLDLLGGQSISARTVRQLARQKKNARGQKSEYFVARSHGNGRPLGIWKLVGPGRVVPIIYFFPHPPNYAKRLPFDEVVEQTVLLKAPRVINVAVNKAIRKRMGA
ncbi:hypothetical protein [Komagataeibacter kakiaceti]|uniref:hypothetical protein n=1 Tax=Komagataeibacter kakiaceti TaxID=943261 RepID=UPI0009FE51E1|nr:hypothetical protein [Komagataeibacter kakiaceti]